MGKTTEKKLEKFTTVNVITLETGSSDYNKKVETTTIPGIKITPIQTTEEINILEPETTIQNNIFQTIKQDKTETLFEISEKKTIEKSLQQVTTESVKTSEVTIEKDKFEILMPAKLEPKKNLENKCASIYEEFLISKAVEIYCFSGNMVCVMTCSSKFEINIPMARCEKIVNSDEWRWKNRVDRSVNEGNFNFSDNL